MMRSAFLLLAVVASICAFENPRDTHQTTQQPGRLEAEVFITKRPFWLNKRQKSEVDEPNILITQEESEAEYWANKRREQHSSDQNPSRIPHKRLRREYNLIQEWFKMCVRCDQKELDMIRSFQRFPQAGDAGLTGHGQRPITEIRLPGDPAKPNRGSTDGFGTYHKGVGLVGHFSAQGELYKSKDGNTVVRGQADVSKVLVGPAHNSKPDASVGVQVQHNF